MNIVEQAREVVEGFMREPWDSPGLIEALDEAGLLRSDPPDEGEVMSFRTTGNNSHIIEDVFKLGYLTDDMAILDPTYGMGVFWKRHRPPFLIGTDLDPGKSPGGVRPLTAAQSDLTSGDEEFPPYNVMASGVPLDFTAMPWHDGEFDAVVFDPPFKMQGTSSNEGPASSNPNYGMDREYQPVEEHLGRIGLGLQECVRVTKPGGVIAVKCMDQIVSGAPVWQSDLILITMHELKCAKFAVFHLEGHRKQPTHDKCKACGGDGFVENPNYDYDLDPAPTTDCTTCDGEGKVPRRQVHERRNYSTLALYRKAK